MFKNTKRPLFFLAVPDAVSLRENGLNFLISLGETLQVAEFCYFYVDLSLT